MQRQGNAGIQNSVLSLEFSKRVAIRVFRVCSIKGSIMTRHTYRSSSLLLLLLPLLFIFAIIPFPALFKPPAARLEVLRILLKRCEPAPSLNVPDDELASPECGCLLSWRPRFSRPRSADRFLGPGLPSSFRRRSAGSGAVIGVIGVLLGARKPSDPSYWR